MTNQELRSKFEEGLLDYAAISQIRKDIGQTAESQNCDQDDPSFLNDFWDNYCPEDDGNEWVRK